MKPQHVALVLAAGGSTRLGQPKQLLTREGETLVHRAARMAIESGALQTFVVTGADADAITGAVRDLSCETLDNPRWSQGLSSSLRRAAQCITQGAASVLVLGCDQPALDGAHLAVLLQASRDATACAAATTYGDDPGIPAVLPRDWFNDADELAGDRGFRERLHALGTTLARIEAPRSLALDIDTPADLQQARELGLIDA